MSKKNIFPLLLAIASASSMGCYSCLQNCGGYGGGYAGQVYDCGCPTCGCPDAFCGCPCPEAACGCSSGGCVDASCGCPDGCCGGVSCGSAVVGPCPLLQCIRNALWGCTGCGSNTYCSEWHSEPPCACDPCDCYGNYSGGNYGGSYGRRASLAKRREEDFGQQLRLSGKEAETTYR